MNNSEKRVATIFDYARMCKSLSSPCRACRECPLFLTNNGYGESCVGFFREYPEEANDMILTWVEEEKGNKAKTYADDFFEKFPDAPRKDETQIPNICLKYTYGLRRGVTCSGHFCEDCWNLPYEESEDEE